MKTELLFDLLNRALEEEIGLVVGTNNPPALSHKLLEAKKGMDKYSELLITIPSAPETLIIAKKTVELDEPVYQPGDLPDV